MLGVEPIVRASDARLPRAGKGTVPLFDVDPDLAGGLEEAAYEEARSALVVPTRVVARGPWVPPRSPSLATVGILVVEGMMVRELRLGAAPPYAELLGPGDLLRPWQDEDGGSLVPWRSSWRALEDCTLAAVGEEVARAAGRWPEVMAAISARAVDRSRKQAIAAAIPSLVRIEERMLVLFAHLAECWGRVTRDGIVLRVPLTHELIACLIGARRPSVTTTLTALRARGLVTRPEPAVWLIDSRIHEELEVVCRGRALCAQDRPLAAA